MAKQCPYHDGPVLYLDCKECEQRICEEDYFWCLVVGSRTFTDFSRMCAVMDHLLCNKSKVFIISGGAKGADQLAEQYAQLRGYPCRVFPANWAQMGKSAGYKRNQQMHSFLSCHDDRGVVAFWDGKSRGTQHNFELSRRYNTNIRVIRFG